MDTATDIPEFGIKRENEERRDGGCAVIFDPVSQKYAVTKDDNDGKLRLASGGVDEGEDMQMGVLREVAEETGLYDFLYVEKIAEAMTHFHNSLKKVNRVAYAACFLVILKSAKTVEVKLEDHEKFSLYWTSYEEIMSNWDLHNKEKGLDHWIYFLGKSVKRAKELGYDKTTVLE